MQALLCIRLQVFTPERPAFAWVEHRMQCLRELRTAEPIGPVVHAATGA